MPSTPARVAAVAATLLLLTAPKVSLEAATYQLTQLMRRLLVLEEVVVLDYHKLRFVASMVALLLI
jgi:hypothetical protein